MKLTSRPSFHRNHNSTNTVASNQRNKSSNPASPRENPWLWFDKIVCINLISRPDRYVKVKQLFNQLNIPVQFYQPEKDKQSGIRGCFNSHIEVIKEAYNEGANNILVFEDDLALTNGFDWHKFDESIRFMKTNNYWQLFYFGSLHDIRKYQSIRIPDYDGIYKTHSMCGHAYVMNRSMMAQYKDKVFDGEAIDGCYLISPEAYAIYPSLFVQGSSDSDTGFNGFSSIEEFDTVKRKLFRANEIYAYNINIPFTNFIPLILLLLFGSLICFPRAKILHIILIIVLVLLLLSTHNKFGLD